MYACLYLFNLSNIRWGFLNNSFPEALVTEQLLGLQQGFVSVQAFEAVLCSLLALFEWQHYSHGAALAEDGS